MPSQDGGWFNHGQSFRPETPEAGEQHPEGTVNRPKLGPRFSVDEARELVTQGNILGDEICAILENGRDTGDSQRELKGHLADHSLSPNERKKSLDPQLDP